MTITRTFLAFGFIYLLLISAFTWLFPKDAEGFISDKNALMLLFVYQIPFSITNAILYMRYTKRVYNHKYTVKRFLYLNIPLLWFPLGGINWMHEYWVATGQLIKDPTTGVYYDHSKPVKPED